MLKRAEGEMLHLQIMEISSSVFYHSTHPFTWVKDITYKVLYHTCVNSYFFQPIELKTGTHITQKVIKQIYQQYMTTRIKKVHEAKKKVWK